VARSLLGSFVSGTRQMLSAQLFISVLAIALAGWTLGLTNALIQERDRLRERVIQLEETMAARGEMPPSPAAVVRTPVAPDYPESIRTAAAGGAQEEVAGGENPFGRIINDLFAPPPPMQTVVLHVRNEQDAARARSIAGELNEIAGVHAVVTTPRQPRAAGYLYYDGRQSRAAAALVQQFNDVAREEEIAAWAAQLRGTALPAQGEYAAGRLDIVLPPLPAPPRADPAALQPQQSAPTP
jgi:hypothetical protein